MATREEVYQAIRIADKAGRREDVLALSAYLDTLGKQDAPVDTTPPGQIPTAPPGGVPLAGPPAQSAAPASTKNASFWDKAVGVGEAGLAAVSAIPSGIIGPAKGVFHTLTSGKYGTPEGAREGDKVAGQFVAENTRLPRTALGQEYLGKVGEYAQGLAPLAGLAGEINTLMRLSKPAITQGRDVGARVVDAAKPTIDPEIMKLAKTAEKYNIPLRPDMLSDSKFGRVAGSFFEDVPLSGSNVKARTTAVNNAITKQIGGDTKSGKLTSDVFVNAMEKNGDSIGSIAAATTIDDVSKLITELDGVVRGSKDYGKDVHRLVRARAEDFKALVKDGRVDGDAFKKWNTKILQDIRTANGEVTKTNLNALQDAAMNTFESYIATDSLPLWKQSRQQYAIGKQIIPLIAEAPTGDMNPASLMRIVKGRKGGAERMAYGQGGELGEIAKVAEQFLGEARIASLPERALGYGMLGALSFGAGGWPGAAAAGGVYGASNLYNRLGPGITRSLTNRLPKQGPVSKPWTTSQGFPEMPNPPPYNPLGDLTPDWSTSAGAGRASQLGIDASGLYPPAGQPPLVPPKGMALADYKPNPLAAMPGVDLVPEPALAGMTPDWSTSRGFSQRPGGVQANALYRAALDDPSVSSRMKGRPQMPVVPGLPGVADVAVAGKGGVWQYGKPWVDASVSVGPEQSRLAAAPMAVGGIELSRLINMPKSANRTKLLNDFKRRYPHASAYIDENMSKP